jgi:hypothetical protein
VLPQRDRDGEDDADESEVRQGRGDHHRAQDRHPPDELQAIGHLTPQRLALGRALRAEPPADLTSPPTEMIVKTSAPALSVMVKAWVASLP